MNLLYIDDLPFLVALRETAEVSDGSRGWESAGEQAYMGLLEADDISARWGGRQGQA